MKLYHGTNQDIETVNLNYGHRYKDFGQGFYLTDDIQTARRMAEKKARLFGGTPTLITYDFDQAVLSDPSFRVKIFPTKATAEWLKFIDRNRDRKQAPTIQEYDIIKGPIADDGVVLQMNDYHEGLKTAEEAAVGLQDKFLDQQYYFGTTKALSAIKKTDVCIVK